MSIGACVSLQSRMIIARSFSYRSQYVSGIVPVNCVLWMIIETAYNVSDCAENTITCDGSHNQREYIPSGFALPRKSGNGPVKLL